MTTDEEAQHQLAKDGLLAPVMDEWSALYKRDFDHWLTYARRLNQTAVGCWIEHWGAGAGGSVDGPLPTGSRIFGRALNTYAATIVLAERTMPLEGLSLARSIYEASFWLGHLSKNPDAALSDLQVDELKNRLAREETLRQRHCDDTDVVLQSNRRCEDMRQILGNRKRTTIDIIAKGLGRSSRYMEYRVLSGFYGHLSEASLQHHLQSKEGIVANTLGPHGEDIPKTVYFASDALIACGMAYSTVLNDPRIAERFQQGYRELKTLERNFEPELAAGGHAEEQISQR